jgi:hypothetical protein
LLYFFHSTQHGACLLEAKTSGKNGFGKPKYFLIMNAGPERKILCIFWYRDNSDVTLTSTNKRNSELIRIAIGQFVASSQVSALEHVELDLHTASFEGEITNRFGRVLLLTSLFPKTRMDAGAALSECDLCS